MTDRPRICIDRIAPRDAGRPLDTVVVPNRGGDGPTRAVVPDTRALWPNGTTLTVGFLGGSGDDQELVREVAPRWTEFANLHLQFVTAAPQAQVRIAFDTGDGAWSYLGDRVLDIPATQPTMNLGWVDEAVILHEFGHTLGLGHEHQNPDGGIEWNDDVVIRDLSGPPNSWSEAQIRHNVLDRYSLDHLVGTSFDPSSIMLYFFPDSWVVGGEGTSRNEVLSDQDEAFIASDAAYPGVVPLADDDLPVSVVSSVAGELTTGGQEQQYRFEVTSAGEHVVQTTGDTDLVMSLYGPDDDTAKIAEDDDSGPGRNPRIAAQLGPGRYLVQLRHYKRASGIGSYEVEVVTRAHA